MGGNGEERGSWSCDQKEGNRLLMGASPNPLKLSWRGGNRLVAFHSPMAHVGPVNFPIEVR